MCAYAVRIESMRKTVSYTRNRNNSCGRLKLANKTVLFVCYGNICRSPMAEGYLRKMLLKRNVKMQVLSAGLNAYGWLPTDEAIELMKRQGVNISDHDATQLTEELIAKAHLILTMEKSHKAAILCVYPQYKHKIFTLKEIAGEKKNLDIKDPYGQSTEAYEACAREIKLYLVKALEKIINFADV